MAIISKAGNEWKEFENNENNKIKFKKRKEINVKVEKKSLTREKVDYRVINWLIFGTKNHCQKLVRPESS